MHPAFRRPGVWGPLLMSLVALAVVLAHLALSGPAREPDEGAAAHVFQLLIAAQVPVMAHAAITGLRRAPKEALAVLALQALAAALALAPVWYFSL